MTPPNQHSSDAVDGPFRLAFESLRQPLRLMVATEWFGELAWIDGFLIFSEWRCKTQRRKTYAEIYGAIRSKCPSDTPLHSRLSRVQSLTLEAIAHARNGEEAQAVHRFHAAYRAWSHFWVLITAADFLSDTSLVLLLNQCKVRPNAVLEYLEDVLRAMVKTSALGHLHLSGLDSDLSARFANRWCSHAVHARRMLSILRENDEEPGFAPTENDLKSTFALIRRAQSAWESRVPNHWATAILDDWINSRTEDEIESELQAQIMACVDRLGKPEVFDRVFFPCRWLDYQSADLRNRLWHTVARVVMMRKAAAHDGDLIHRLILQVFHRESSGVAIREALTATIPEGRRQLSRHLGNALISEFGGYINHRRLAKLVGQVLQTIPMINAATNDNRDYSIHQSDISLFDAVRLALLNEQRAATDRRQKEPAKSEYQPLPLIALRRPELGQLWNQAAAIRLDDVLGSNKSFVLSAIGGGGKSTCLRHLQHRLLKERAVLAIFIDAQDAVHWKQGGDVLTRIAHLVPGHYGDPTLRAVLNRSRRDDRICLLLDNVDPARMPPTAIEALMRSLLRLDVRIIAAAQPSHAELIADAFGLDRVALGPLDAHAYFGPAYPTLEARLGPHHLFLEVPMYAQLLADVIRQDPDETPRNLWDLYSQAVWMRVSGSLSRLRQRHPLSDPQRALINLGELAYWALSQPTPHLGTIDISGYTPFRRDNSWSLERVVRTGLVDIVQPPGGSPAQHVQFVHESIQSFLAANAIVDDKILVQLVLDEYRNPKWRNVILFLAGRLGSSFVANLSSPDNMNDDVIHERLFLAAECSGQTTVAARLEKYLVDKCEALAGRCPFEFRALSAMAGVDTHQAHDRLWRRLQVSPTVAIDSFGIDTVTLASEPSIANRLYSPERLRHAIAEVGNNRPLPALHFLKQWAAAVPESALEVLCPLVSRNLTDVSVAATECLVALCPRFGNRIRHFAMSLLVDARLGPQNAGIRILSGMADILTAEERRAVLSLILNKNPFVAIEGLEAAARMQAVITERDLAFLMHKFWEVDADCAAMLGRLPVAVKRMLPDSEITRLMEHAIAQGTRHTERAVDQKIAESDMRDSQANAHESAAWMDPVMQRAAAALTMLRGCGNRLTVDSIQSLADQMEVPALTATVIETLATFGNRLDPSNARRILDLLESPDADVVAAAARAVPALKTQVTPDDVQKILARCESMDHDGAACIHAASTIISRLTAQQVDYLRRCLSDFGDGRSTDFRAEICARIAPYLRRSERPGDLYALLKGRLEDEAEAIIWSIDPTNATIDETAALVCLLNHSMWHIARLAYGKLIEIHRFGRAALGEAKGLWTADG